MTNKGKPMFWILDDVKVVITYIQHSHDRWPVETTVYQCDCHSTGHSPCHHPLHQLHWLHPLQQQFQYLLAVPTRHIYWHLCEYTHTHMFLCASHTCAHWTSVSCNRLSLYACTVESWPIVFHNSLLIYHSLASHLMSGNSNVQTQLWDVSQYLNTDTYPNTQTLTKQAEQTEFYAQCLYKLCVEIFMTGNGWIMSLALCEGC